MKNKETEQSINMGVSELVLKVPEEDAATTTTTTTAPPPSSTASSASKPPAVEVAGGKRKTSLKKRSPRSRPTHSRESSGASSNLSVKFSNNKHSPKKVSIEDVTLSDRLSQEDEEDGDLEGMDDLGEVEVDDGYHAGKSCDSIAIPNGGHHDRLTPDSVDSVDGGEPPMR